MRYTVTKAVRFDTTETSVLCDRGDDEFTSFPAEVGNPVYDSFLESQSLTDADVQAMTPDVWHDMA